MSDAPTQLELIFVQNSNDFRVLPFRFSLVRQWREYIWEMKGHTQKKKLMEYQTKQTTTMGQRIGLVTVMCNVIRSEESSVFVAVACLGA